MRYLLAVLGLLLATATGAWAQPAPPGGGGIGTPPPRFTLTVSRLGTGVGSITGSGITCGTDCTQTYNAGTVVTLTASANGFAGWSGACAGTGACNVTMSQAQAVSATFTSSFPGWPLAWNDNATNEVSQEIWRRSPCGAAAGPFSLLITLAPNVVLFTDATALEGVNYEYEARAANGGGASAFSNLLCATHTGWSLAWNDNATDETAQEVWRRSPCGTGSFAFLSAVAANVVLFTDATAVAAVSYEYEVRATKTGASPSGFSNALCVP